MCTVYIIVVEAFCPELYINPACARTMQTVFLYIYPATKEKIRNTYSNQNRR